VAEGIAVHAAKSSYPRQWIRWGEHGGGEETWVNALIIMEPTKGLDELAARLRALGVSPIVGLGLHHAARLLASFRPDLAIVGQGAQTPHLLRRLDERGVPVVLVDNATGLAEREELRVVVSALLSPVKPDRQPNVVDLTDRASDESTGEMLDVGRVVVDRVGRVAFVGGERVEIPPMELTILEELALHPGEPVPASVLRTRLWPGDGPATNEDVHRHVYRLRKLLGDQDRRDPLITNRRGFGYVLEVSERVPTGSRSAGAGAGVEVASGE
jgi:DNA-binding response OmpR family regulator